MEWISVMYCFCNFVGQGLGSKNKKSRVVCLEVIGHVLEGT